MKKFHVYVASSLIPNPVGEGNCIGIAKVTVDENNGVVSDGSVALGTAFQIGDRRFASTSGTGDLASILNAILAAEPQRETMIISSSKVAVDLVNGVTVSAANPELAAIVCAALAARKTWVSLEKRDTCSHEFAREMAKALAKSAAKKAQVFSRDQPAATAVPIFRSC